MKTVDIRQLNDEELKKGLEKAHRDLFDLRFKLSTKQLVNHREVPRAKKDIARLETIIRERELGINND